MKFPVLIKLIVVVVFFILASCNRSTKESEQTVLEKAAIDSLPANPEGIVYFSYDNGLTWENKSAGLLPTASIGLGGIAVSDDKLSLLSKDKGIYFFNSQEDKWINVPTDEQLLNSNPAALIFYKNWLFVGTQTNGVFNSKDGGKTWLMRNGGLDNLTVRRFSVVEDKIYAGTNSGLYKLNESTNTWELEYGGNTMQVNGITEFNGNVYIATTQGAFTSPIGKREWRSVLPDYSIHNISVDDKHIYAMTYNELFSSIDNGKTWQSLQRGLPKDLYTFSVIKHGNSVFAGQWDGIYIKESEYDIWKNSSNGLPKNLAFSNIQVYNGIIVASGNESKLRTGMSWINSK